MFCFKKKPQPFLPNIGGEYPINPETLLSFNPICSNICCVGDTNIRMLLTYTSEVSVNIGQGIRISIETTNEVSILCIGNAQIIEDETVDKLTVSFGNNKKDRIVTFLNSDASKYRLTCKQVIIESYEQYCAGEDGTRTSIWEVAKQYQSNAADMRIWLNELKAKRIQNQ